MNSLVVALLLTQLSAVPPEPPYEDATSRRLYEWLTTAVSRNLDIYDKHRLEDAARDLVHREPLSPTAWWTSGLAFREDKVGNRQFLRRALELGITGPKRAQALFALTALAAIEAEPRVDRWFEEALATSWDDARVLSKGASYLMQVKDYSRAGRVLERLVWLPPVKPQIRADYALVLGEMGQYEAAARQVKLAREDGVDKVYFHALVMQAKRTWLDRWLTRLFVGQVLVLSLSLLLLYLAGTLLSRVQLRRLAAVDARLLRKEQTPQERLTDRLYNGVLWAASLLFYVFAFSVVGLSVGGIWGLFIAPSVLVCVMLALNLWGVWNLLSLVVLRDRWGVERRLLTEAEAPRLFVALEEVARVADLPPLDRVYLDPDADISVAEEGGTWKVVTGRGERVLRLGFAAFRALSVSEMKAILAHEYGHLSHGEVRLAPIFRRTLASVAHTLRSIESIEGQARYLNPWYGFLRAYFFIYLGVSQAHSRRCELLADRSAAMAYGGSTFGTALTKAVRNADLFARLAPGTLTLMRRTLRPCEDLYRCLDAADVLTPRSLQSLRTRELTAREADTYDSHPPPKERIQRVAGIRGQKPLETAPALTLLESPERLAQELTHGLCMKLVARIRLEGGQPLPLRTDVGPEAQEQFASAFALFQDAMELQERGHAEADPTMVDCARLVEASVDPDEPLLVNVLQEAAGAYHRLGESAAAEASLQRARAVVESHSDWVDNRGMLQMLDQQLAAVRAPGRMRAPLPARPKATSGAAG